MGGTSSRVRALVGAIAGAVIASGLMGVPVAASAADTASISGTVTVPAGSNPQEIRVTARPDVYTNGGIYHDGETVWVGPDGTYEITGLAAGDYSLYFDTEYTSPRLAWQYWGGALLYDKAARITLGAGQSLTADVSLSAAATVTGQVHAPAGVDVGQVDVAAYSATDGSGYVDYVSLESDGTYVLDGLPAGDYKFYFFSYYSAKPFAPQWWQDASDFSGATVATLASGGSATANATLAAGASISGVVTGSEITPHSHMACANRVVDPDAAADVDSNGQCAEVAGNGVYTIAGLRAGTYKVSFWRGGYGGGSWKGEWMDVSNRKLWWNDKPGSASATPLTITADEAKTGVNENLDTTGGKSTWPTITGTAKVGEKLTATPGVWPAGTTIRYSWYSTDGKWYADTSSGSITVPTAAANKTLGVNVYGLTGDLDDASYSGQAAWQVQHFEMGTKIVPLSLTTAMPTISGTLAYGSTLTAKPGSWTSGATLKYQWLANGAEISGATKSTLKLGSAQKGKQISVTVTGSKTGYTTVSKTSAKSAKVATAATPTVSGTLAYASTLTAKPGSWTSGSSFKYQWLANGVAIKGATKSTLKLGSAQKGKQISVTVTGSKSGYATVAKTSAKSVKVATAVTPKISGSVKVGKKLTVVKGTWTSGTSFSYQWYASGKAISKATKSTFTLTKSQKGKTITVKVTGKKSGYATVAKTSKATGKVK